ncbi:hypothetical protein ACQ4PT_025758 [Festuca glaucescens]
MGENPCTLLVHFDKGSPDVVEKFMVDLQGSDVAAKIAAMKLVIMLLLNGNKLPPLLRTLTLYVLPRKEPTFEKLFFLYLEIIDKRDAASGEVCPDIILFVKYFRYNLEKRNEYVRAITLRLLCRFREPELLHPLLPCIIANLEHEQDFVRRHALSAILAIYHLPRGHMPIPYADMCKLVLRAVAFDQDADVRRTAFILLCDCAQDLAVKYLLDNAPYVAKWPDLLQMAALDLICKVCRSLDHSDEGGYMKIIFSILSNCKTAAVQYKCAGTFLSLSSRPISVQVAAKTYCKLLTSQSDNNVNLIILDRLHELCTSHRYVMANFVMALLHSLAIPNVNIRRKVLDLVLGLLTARNVQEVVLYLKKEVVKMQGIELEKAGEYHQMLVQAIHACAVEHPEVAGSVVYLLVDFLGESNSAIAYDVVLSVREIMETNPMLRESMIQRLFSAFGQIQESFVCSRALWMLAEYSFSAYEVESAISTIKQSIGNLSFYTVSEERESTDTSKPAHPMMNSCTACSKRSTVLADDACATHNFATNAAISAPVAHGLLASKQYLRSLVVSGDFHLAAVVACTLTKLVLRLEEVQPSKVEVWLLSFRQSFAKMLAEKMKIKAPISIAQPDDLIDFYHLKRRALNQRELDDDYRDYLKAATVDVTKGADGANRLNRLVQLTGFSDPAYAEAYVMVNQYYNAVVDVTVINRTNEALQNLCLEFVTEGKNVIITDRSENYTLAPQESKQIQVNIEITRANSAVILGHIVYETSDGKEHSELKVNTVLQDERKFLNHIIKSTNMTCLTPPWALDGDCGFIAANLYAKSVFGEDVLMNICVEKQADGKLNGCISIKGNVEGMVLSLGERKESASDLD